MQIKHSRAVELLQELGVSAADNWNDKKLTKGLRGLDDLVDDETDIEDEDLAQLADDILSIDDPDEVEVVPDGKSNGKKGKGKKAAVVDDDSDDDEEEEEEEEEEKPMKKKTAKGKSTANGKATKKKKGAKAAPEKKVTKKAAKKRAAPVRTGGPSNKERIYKEWKKSPKKATVERMFAMVDEAVKESTIRGWLSAWARGQNLPAVAREE